MLKGDKELNYAIFSANSVAAIKHYLDTQPDNSLFLSALYELKESTDLLLQKPLDVPGQGEAGSYEHNQHKSNYELMDNCAKLYIYFKDEQYVNTVRNLLLEYSRVYLEMPFYEQRNTNPPGRLFHQILNEHMWLFYASLAYSVIKDDIDKSDRNIIEDRLFHPMIEMFTVLYGHDFDRIHNHGIWAVAAVGLCGLNVGNKKVVEQSIFGLNGDETTGGFLAQISQLFSASGYYIEGPYYHRFALRPTVIFAEAIHLHFPELDIYNYFDGVIGKTIKALLFTSNPDGTFPALNDASLTMNINDEGALAALSIYFARYGKNDMLVAAAKQENTLWLSPCSLALSQAADEYKGEASVRWPSIELTEGANEEKGGQGFLRSRNKTLPVTQAIMGYGQHGMGHGHFDTLGITLFANGHEFLREYGFSRWINVEPKFGGRYLDENKSWARQTIAHNGVTVDQTTQNEFNVKRADNHYGKRHFFISEKNIQAMSAFANDHYDGVEMQRTVVLIEHEDFEHPLTVDLYRLASKETHQYDFAVHYKGQFISTNLNYEYNLNRRNVLGDSNGYQHLFEKARASVAGNTQITWLQDNCFHTWNCFADTGEMIFAQTGANDPSMNLRTEDCFILRTEGDDSLFVSTYETHGLFDEAFERCSGALNQVHSIRTLLSNNEYSVVEIDYTLNDTVNTLVLCVSNQTNLTEEQLHQVAIEDRNLQWTGPIALIENV